MITVSDTSKNLCMLSSCSEVTISILPLQASPFRARYVISLSTSYLLLTLFKDRICLGKEGIIVDQVLGP